VPNKLEKYFSDKPGAAYKWTSELVLTN
jgi:hypothetical protein